jgi:hypothetical protein
VQPLLSGTAELIRNSDWPASNFVCRKKTRIKYETVELKLLRRRRGFLKSKGGDGDAAASVAHAVEEGDGEEEKKIDAAAAMPHTVAPVEALNAYCCGGERSAYCCGGTGESKGGDGDAAASVAHVVEGAKAKRNKTSTRLFR